MRWSYCELEGWINSQHEDAEEKQTHGRSLSDLREPHCDWSHTKKAESGIWTKAIWGWLILQNFLIIKNPHAQEAERNPSRIA